MTSAPENRLLTLFGRQADAPDLAPGLKSLDRAPWLMDLLLIANMEKVRQLATDRLLGSFEDRKELDEMIAELAEAAQGGAVPGNDALDGLKAQAACLAPAQLLALAKGLRGGPERSRAMETLSEYGPLYARLADDLAKKLDDDIVLAKADPGGEGARLEDTIRLFRDNLQRRGDYGSIGDVPAFAGKLEEKVRKLGEKGAMDWLKAHPEALNIRPDKVKLGIGEKFRTAALHGTRGLARLRGQKFLTGFDHHNERGVVEGLASAFAARHKRQDDLAQKIKDIKQFQSDLQIVYDDALEAGLNAIGISGKEPSAPPPAPGKPHKPVLH